MARSPSFAGVILAAGESSRLGRDKALLPWHGATFLEAAIEAIQPHCELVIVVVGKNFESLKPIVYTAGAFIITNPAPERGQFSSLQVGLQEVLNQGRDAALITLVDRPPAKRETIAALRHHFLDVCASGYWSVVPEYEGRHGHPIIVGREMIEAFLKAPVASTARDVEHAHIQKINYFPVSDPAVITNIDTPEDYERIRQ